ncbi:MAG: molybdopterin oxidoreductase family protein [Actinobacteria bacterium]|nr:molybdopterin oxidoreductase family protein [Actinomycetota bacterium]
MADRVAIRTCPLCEAGCGLEITVRDDTSAGASGARSGTVIRIRGDMNDVFSKGYICPKGSTLKQLHEDPDRLRQPLVKRDGKHVEVSWEEAWEVVDRGLTQVIASHGRESIGAYLGNPGAHNLAAMTFNRVLLTAIGSRQRFSASSVDQVPKQVSAGFMFGTAVSVPVPDLDRTDYLLMLGANPYASNGSLATAPDWPGRLEAIRARGGKIIVVDPRRSRTAESADEWLAIRPGTDALLLAAMVTAVFEAGRAEPGEHLAGYVNGIEDVHVALAEFTPERVERAVGIDAATIRRIALELCDAPRAAVYGRIGTCTVAFGTTASWLVDVLNAVTGNLDIVGGAMFPLPVAVSPTTRGKKGVGKGFKTGRGKTRVRGFPEALGEYPAALMAEEIQTPGSGQIRAMVVVGGNPVRSTPNTTQLGEAFDSLDFMVSVDIYLNETSRHADVILPPPSHLQRSHYDLALLNFALRSVANYSEPVFDLPPGVPDEWEVLARLAGIAQGLGANADPATIDDITIRSLIESTVRDDTSVIAGRNADEIYDALSGPANGSLRGPDRILDLLLRTGPFGEGFGANPDGVSVAMLKRHPHGVDYGAMVPRIPEALRTPSGKVELAPPELLADIPRLRESLQYDPEQVLLVGRRHLRSNNSWMHNIRVLVKGKPRCTLQIHPDDAARLGVVDGAPVRVTSRVGSVVAPAEITDGIRPRVVSLPHGWGHDEPGTRQSVAREYAGVNSNVLTDHEAIDPLSGNAVLNGIPVALAVVATA